MNYRSLSLWDKNIHINQTVHKNLWESGACFMVFSYTGNSNYSHGRTDQRQRFKSKREISNGKDCVIFHRTTAFHCCHSFLSLEAMHDSWSALPLKYEPGQNRIRTFLKTPVVFPGFSLLSPLALLSCGFRGSSGCGPTSISRPLLNERQLFLFTLSLSGSAWSLSLSFSFNQCLLIT